MSSTVSVQAPRFSREHLHPYQRRAVSFIKQTPSCALWVDMGLGKTIIVLTAITDLLARFEAGRVLVIAPLRVALNTWPQEIGRWAHTRHLAHKVLAGCPPERRAALVADDVSDIHIINRELVPWLVDACKGARHWPYDMVVIDEASSFKSSRTRRWKAMRKVLPATDRLVQLTGTPAGNGLLDVWAQVFLLDRGERLGKTFTGFRERYFDSDYMGYRWTLREGASQKIYDRLADICLTLSAKDWLDLPPRIDNIVHVDLPGPARAQYRQLERDFLAEVGDGEIVEVLHAAALSNKLLQFAGGAVYTDGEKNWAEVHAGKLDALESIVNEAAGTPVLVACNYRTDTLRILERFAQAETLGRDPDTIARWNRGEIPLLLAHPASAGHGLNLQQGGHTIVWFGLNWSLELYQQFNARLHRQGQQRPVVIHHIVARETVDETVMKALAGKDSTQRALLDALRDDIRERVA